jgi:quercetin dioxygenase-like cupin family protein
MSRPASREKLATTMSTLLLHVERDTDPPTGWVRDADGIQHGFAGWLGLMRVLEDHLRSDCEDAAQANPKGGRMTTTPTTPTAPIALQPDEGEALWFLGVLATIKATAESTNGRVAVIEHLAPRGSGSPLHVHHNEDEWFYVTEGELTFWVGGRTIVAGAGSFVYGPRDIPHTFAVSSDQARFLLVTEPAGFENFMRALAVPAERLGIPPAPTAPPDMEEMQRLAAEYGIEILGPPGIPA